MAVTIELAHDWGVHSLKSLVNRGAKVCLAKVTFDSSYPTGGEPMDFTAYGITKVWMVIPIGMPSGYGLMWDPANNKMLVYTGDYDPAADQPFQEVDNATDLSALVAYVVVIGDIGN